MHARPRSRQRGLATVELALVAPVLLVLMLTVSELGRALYQYNTLVKAVRDGARYMSANARNDARVVDIVTCADPLTSADCATSAKNLVVYGQTTAGTTALLPGFATSTVSVTTVGSDDVKVTATYAYQPLFASMPVNLFTGDSRSTAFTFSVTSEAMAL